MRRSEESSAPQSQRLISRLAVGHPQRHGVTYPVRIIRRREDSVGLSAVGPPPLTRSSQVSAKRSTTLVPPYSR